MSYQEQLTQFTTTIPEWQAENALLMLQAFVKALDDAEDDAFCMALYKKSLEEDQGPGIPIEELAEGYGVVLE